MTLNLLCATPVEYWFWLTGHVDGAPKEIVNPARSFCGDASIDWCREMRAAGCCHLSDRAFEASVRQRQEEDGPSFETFTYPLTGTVHLVNGTHSPCGVWVDGFRLLHPRWEELYGLAQDLDVVTCQKCRRYALSTAA